jgi:hypothetical protein
MGGCFSSKIDANALKTSKNLEKMMNQSFILESEKIKLLLLGAGESGKSTIFKQMRVLFGAPLTEDERNQITPVVYSNTISAMKALAQAVRDFGYEDEVSFMLCRQMSTTLIMMLIQETHILDLIMSRSWR